MQKSHLNVVFTAVIGCVLAAPAHGQIVNTSFIENPLSFTSTWDWTFNLVTGWGGMDTKVGQFWQATMIGTFAPGGGDLQDVSQHLVNPHGGEILPPLTFFNYPLASTGVGPVFSWIGHPGQGHINVYSLRTVPAGGRRVTIFFEGVHGPLLGNLRMVPAPSSIALLALGGLIAVRRRR